MAFGIRLPGIGISTRGVRVGPRIANVGVGRGGVRASVGPRIANVGVGRGGIRVGSGLGPLYVSNRGAGISVGGVRVSNRGVGASVGAGPFWLGGNARWPSLKSVGRVYRGGGIFGGGVTNWTGRVLQHGGSGGALPVGVKPGTAVRTPQPLAPTSRIFSATNPHVGNQYLSYRNQLMASGAKRRNKYEVRAAAAQALFWSGASLAAVMRSYGSFVSPQIPELPSVGEMRRAARSRLRARRAIPIYSLGRNTVVDAELVQVRAEIESRRLVIHRSLHRALRKVLACTEPQVGIAVDTLLADNLFPARWIGQSQGHGVVVVAFGPVEEMVWPEEIKINANGQVGVHNLTKENMGRMHRRLLARAFLATAKEVLNAHSHLQAITVVAVGADAMASLLDCTVWGFCTVQRSDLSRLVSSDAAIEQLIALEKNFGSVEAIDDDSVYPFFSQLMSVWETLDNQVQNLSAHFMSGVYANPAKKGLHLEPVGTLDVVFKNEPALLGIFRSAKIPAPTSAEDAWNLDDINFWLSLA
jgi:hypothetical protein